MTYCDLDEEASLLADYSKTDDVGFFSLWTQLLLLSLKYILTVFCVDFPSFFANICFFAMFALHEMVIPSISLNAWQSV